MTQTRPVPRPAASRHHTIGGVMVDIALIAFLLGVFRASLVVGSLNALVLLLAVIRARGLRRRREALHQAPSLRDSMIDLIRSYFCALVLLTSLLATLLVVGLLGYFAVGPVSPLLAILAAGFVGYWVGRAIWPGWPRTKGPEITWIGEVMERPAVSGVRSEGGPDESGVLSSGLDHLDREWPL